jgi:hypothetical protein
MKWYQIMEVTITGASAGILAVVFCLTACTFIATCLVGCGGCGVKDPACGMINAGIEYIDSQLADTSPTDPDTVDDVFASSIAPAIRAKGMSDILDQAKEYWDSIPTETKLKAGRKILVYMRDSYCVSRTVPALADVKIGILSRLRVAGK